MKEETTQIKGKEKKIVEQKDGEREDWGRESNPTEKTEKMK